MMHVTRSLIGIAAIASAAAAQQSAPKPLTPDAYDQWRTIQGEKVSNDGRWVVYSLVPQVGDGELVVKAVPSGPEYRRSRGFIGRPEIRAGAQTRTGYRAPEPAITADGKFVVFTIDPPRNDVERARREKKKPAEQPKASLGILRTADGNVSVVPNVKSFRVAKDGSRYVAYLLEPRDSASLQKSARDSLTPVPAAAATPGGRPRPVAADSAGRREPKRETGSTLVVRDLQSGSEITIEDVTAYALTDAGGWLGYTVGSHAGTTDGAYVRSLADGRTTPLLAGRGSYRQLAFDKAGTQVAFLSDREEQSLTKPRYRLYHASLGAPPAHELVGPKATGESVVSPTARVEFSEDGRTIIFGVAPAPLDSIPADSLADKAVFDLWHYKDARLQPQQRVEATRDRERGYTAVYRLDAKRYQQLGNDTLQVRLARNSSVAFGTASLPYALQQMWGEGGSDLYVIDAAGNRKLVKTKAPIGEERTGEAGISPDGRFVLYFGDDAHWYAYSVATGQTVDLSARTAGVRFEREQWDSPSLTPAWGVAGWTKGDRSVLLYDRYDIWELDPSGERSARVVTDSLGRRDHLVFRVVETDTTEHAIDPGQPLLLRATNDETKASGYWRDRLGVTAPPVKLLMLDKQLGRPVKARNADVFVFTESTFREFPDLWVSDGQFTTQVKISDANPQQKDYKWGAAQLVSWRNDDGVELKGILFKPDGFDPRRKYPMVVYYYELLSENLHGYVAPAGRNVINPTVYASNDYLVFEPDIVYTVGYPGQSAYKSIVPGVQMLIDSGFVDARKIGLQGQSWGGYQTAFLITQTNMFAAAMAGAPVANMTSAYGGIRWQSGLARAFQYEHTQSRIGGSIWQFPLRYLENSPLFFVDRVRTPLLIMSNDGDGSVPWYQGIELFVAMRRFGKEVYLIDYNGDEHNPTKRANQLDIAMRMQQFFDHHLKGAPAPAWMEKGIPFLQKGRDQLAASRAAGQPPAGSGESREIPPRP
ncbi:MAG: prolyl oligopeptidase family serine peptidase [Gemmatimonadota bacterium]|nr:prolyl oligopeptidase family serine peptidase [Gemmatimonadota bacterium]